jgi:4a-hydroxytetrahydrobiopterin dehydratase
MKYFLEQENILSATFEFQSFQKALDFVNQVGNIAEISNHHPDIKLHDYKYVTIETTTHDM